MLMLDKWYEMVCFTFVFLVQIQSFKESLWKLLIEIDIYAKKDKHFVF